MATAHLLLGLIHGVLCFDIAFDLIKLFENPPGLRLILRTVEHHACGDDRAVAAVERGDLVSTRLVEKRDSLPGLLPAVNRMVALVAKHDTLAAQTFDAPKPAAGNVPPSVQSLQALR